MREEREDGKNGRGRSEQDRRRCCEKGYEDNDNYVSVRIEPGKDSKVLFGIDNGHKVTTTDNMVTKDGCDWYEVKLPGRNTICGWIEGSYLGYEKQ